MEYFINRSDAGKQLAELLKKYKNQDVIVYALPRGGVVVAYEIAKALKAPLDLIFAHKIGHPYHAEYAVGAVTESGLVFAEEPEYIEEEAKKRQMDLMKQRRKLYLKGRPPLPAEGKTAIIVDDGVATGRTLKAGILELRKMNPETIVVAVPVAPESTLNELASLADEAVCLLTPSDGAYLGAVGAYYLHFGQVEDEEVIALLGMAK